MEQHQPHAIIVRKRKTKHSMTNLQHWNFSLSYQNMSKNEKKSKNKYFFRLFKVISDMNWSSKTFQLKF